MDIITSLADSFRVMLLGPPDILSQICSKRNVFIRRGPTITSTWLRVMLTRVRSEPHCFK